MREPIRFVLNGEPVEAGCRADATVLEWLRGEALLRGTKEGCAEGDCSACSVLIQRPDAPEPEPVNACILTMGQIAGAALTTVEGLAATAAGGNAVQRAMAVNGSSQCGFCTPGIVVALTALANANDNPTDDEVHEAMAGNLCRCTGYRPIVEAARAAAAEVEPLAPPATWPKAGDAAGSAESHYLRPGSLVELLRLREANPEAPLLAGGTDLGLSVAHAKARWPVAILTRHVPELRAIEETDLGFDIGAAATWSEILPVIEPHYPAFGTIIRRFGSAQVRSVGTMGGNLGTASPIGDAAPTLLAIGATLRLVGPRGERMVALEEYFQGYRKTALRPGEIIRSIVLRKPARHEQLHVWKVSKRFDQDISTVCAAFFIDVDGGRIGNARTGFGGMDAVPARALAVENALAGAVLDDLSAAADAAREAFTPLSDMRATDRYRATVAGNLVLRLQAVLTGGAAHVSELDAALPEAAE